MFSNLNVISKQINIGIIYDLIDIRIWEIYVKIEERYV